MQFLFFGKPLDREVRLLFKKQIRLYRYLPKISLILFQAFPKYGLYVYGEGKAAAYLEKGKFSGIPVLFIPGNSGSYKQVRSLASVALRQPYKTSHLASESEYCHRCLVPGLFSLKSQ